MRLVKALISVALVADAAVASSNSWFSKAGKYSNRPFSFVLILPLLILIETGAR